MQRWFKDVEVADEDGFRVRNLPLSRSNHRALHVAVPGLVSLRKDSMNSSLESLDGGGLRTSKIAEKVEVADGSRDSIVRESARAFEEARESGTATIATALHVGGLNSLHDADFSSALGRARVVYADGIAVVLLARIAGATDIERAATTDIGVPIIRAIGDLLNRPVRLALLGGKPGLAIDAGSNLELATNAEIVYTTDGYKDPDEWTSSLADLRAAKPDVVLIGLGSPRELIFADGQLESFPPALLVTCGGWFGFLAGEEPRAPKALRAIGLEWVGRLLHDPVRLRKRYIQGGIVFFAMSLKLVLKRIGMDK